MIRYYIAYDYVSVTINPYNINRKETIKKKELYREEPHKDTTDR